MFADMTDPAWALATQIGALGLLAYIVVYSVPRAMREAREERQTRDSQFAAVIHLLQQQFDARSDKVVAAVQVQTVSLGTTFEKSLGRVERAVHASCHAREMCANFRAKDGAEDA